jgi:hypothetical protein
LHVPDRRAVFTTDEDQYDDDAEDDIRLLLAPKTEKNSGAKTRTARSAARRCSRAPSRPSGTRPSLLMPILTIADSAADGEVHEAVARFR